MDFPTVAECENAIYKIKGTFTNSYKKAVSNNVLDNILNSQQQLLKNCILSNGKQDFFNVFDMQCSTGKTYVAVNSMPYYLYNVSLGHIAKKGVLFVIRQTDEIDKYVKDLNSLFKDEITGHFKEVAIAYHYKKYSSEERFYK